MTPRERWQAVLAHSVPDRIPTDYWGVTEITESLLSQFGLSSTGELWKKLNIDKVHSVNPTYVGPALEPGTGMWGVRHREVVYADRAGIYSEPDNHPWAEFETVDELRAAARSRF